MNLNERLIVALDVPTAPEALQLADALAAVGCRFKIGLELFNSYGPEVVRAIGPERVFLDVKLHDIPNTVAGAARAAARLGVWVFNVHAFGGVEMMLAAVEAARAEAGRAGAPPPLVLAVTVLTSISRDMMNRELGVPGAVEGQVQGLARLALQAGLDGVVCSPREALWVRDVCGPDFVIVTPGVRPAGAEAQDHQRVATPAEALRVGANYLVVGRPITRADDPAAAARLVIAEIGRATS